MEKDITQRQVTVALNIVFLIFVYFEKDIKDLNKEVNCKSVSRSDYYKR